MKTNAAFLLVLAGACTVKPAFSQTSPAWGHIEQAAAAADAQQLADYLGLLRKISPAVESAAHTYLAATRLRCGRILDTAALRRAMAEDGGDPVLMGLIRAAATKDAAARSRLVAQMPCASRTVP